MARNLTIPLHPLYRVPAHTLILVVVLAIIHPRKHQLTPHPLVSLKAMLSPSLPPQRQPTLLLLPPRHHQLTLQTCFRSRLQYCRSVFTSTVQLFWGWFLFIIISVCAEASFMLGELSCCCCCRYMLTLLLCSHILPKHVVCCSVLYWKLLHSLTGCRVKTSALVMFSAPRLSRSNVRRKRWNYLFSGCVKLYLVVREGGTGF